MQKLKLLAGVCAVVLMSAGLGGCLEGLSNQLAGVVGAGTDKVLNEIDEAGAGADDTISDKVDGWLADNGMLANGASCSTASQCASGNCSSGSGNTCQPLP